MEFSYAQLNIICDALESYFYDYRSFLDSERDDYNPEMAKEYEELCALVDELKKS